MVTVMGSVADLHADVGTELGVIEGTATSRHAFDNVCQVIVARRVGI